MLFVSTVAAFYCFFIRLLGASKQKPKREYFGCIMFRKRLLFRVTLAPDNSMIQPCEKGRMLSRLTVTI